MSKNTNKAKSQSNKAAKKQGFFSRFEQVVSFETVFRDGLPVKFLPYILFYTAICIFYIGHTHYVDKTILKINRLEQEVEDLRADFQTSQAEYKIQSKQSEVAKRVKALKLKESDEPPYKIELTEK
ncbi:FtsL-like putative cell division protein [Mangrovivirga sp. M17]|uniref:FtsL-like putative cell division protein n=1 Tax=Mangrovivirga halotolerans TaxID=2993936 RepID=A0ABT3RLI7_9BACT|nr:FtsL-like putative cell division protein [Mangrovivirga halotolerans]MCX2742655.1 FtsL-like putative cell division protein [Mangrovivirga halotolerans]